jgi:hypothetical protein
MPAAFLDNPDKAALELIMGIHVLREYTSALRAEHAFGGLSWSDARHVAAAIS